jgi:hypothetical protein
MRNFELPRRGSSPHLCLSALNNIGGTASVQALMKVRNWKGKIAPFCEDILARLVRCELMQLVGDQCAITDAGRKYLGVKLEEAQGPAGEPAGPRYVAPMRPLNRTKHFPPRPLRPEGDEFRAIPSLMADQRIEYRPGVVAPNA